MTRFSPRLRWGVLWYRLIRWWGESRIRLPSAGLRPQALRPGDRLQIGSRLWRVAAGSDTDSVAIFELTAADGLPGQAQLRVRGGQWTLIEPGGRDNMIELDPAAMIHFPVAEQA